VALALAVGSAAALASAPAHAGGAIGWANAVTQFSTEGQAVGAAAVILGIIAIGAVLFFGLSGLVGTVIMACLGGALMANAQQVASIFGGGGGGGSSVFGASSIMRVSIGPRTTSTRCFESPELST
jgi:hypothetical protein